MAFVRQGGKRKRAGRGRGQGGKRAGRERQGQESRGRKAGGRERVGQMLKWKEPDLLFIEKCGIFVLPKEETERIRRLPPFLVPACAKNYPALGQNYKALGFVYVLLGRK